MTKAPLIQRAANDHIAWCIERSPQFDHTGVVNVKLFLQHVSELVELLPPNYEHCINLCHNRYLFMLTFCAVITRKQTNLLPSNKNTLTQKNLAERYAKSYIVSDSDIKLAADIDSVSLNNLTLSVVKGEDHFDVPSVELNHVAAICFTSGSTGDAKAIVKHWHTFVESTKINSAYMLPDLQETHYHLATVPSQHMWGLETTVLMALLSPVCLVDAQPFYPHDICTQLAILPNTRALVTTPLHLRALNSVQEPRLILNNILVATAPINQELTQSIEDKFNTQVREVYGCSEIGSMAIRRSAREEQWQQFEGLDYNFMDNGTVLVTGKHLPQGAVLDDQLSQVKDNYFILSGRNSDQIKIAGKRGSLNEVNKVLMGFRGLIDGVVIFPSQDNAVPRLVAIVVLSDTTNKKELREYFSQYLDAAFIPRPILVVDALPREDSGKLIKSKAQDLYRSLVVN